MVSSKNYRARASAVAALRSLWAHRGLTAQLAWRDVVSRYKGSMLGIAWSLLHPLLMLMVYAFVFGVVFKARWGVGTNETPVDFALVLFVGLIVHALFAEAVNRAPSVVVSNASFVKRVVFPLEVLPLVPVCSAIFHGLVSFVVLLAGLMLTGAPLHAMSLLFPVVLAPLVLGTLGVVWVLASLGVYLRDIGQATGIVTTVMLFLSPVFYPASALPPSFGPVFTLNPLTFIIEQARAVVIWGQAPDWLGLAVYTLCAGIVAAAGFWWFQRTRHGFADVL